MLIPLLALFGCREPQLQPIGEAVGTGVAVGWAAAVAARADAEGSPECVQRSNTCNDPESCAGTVIIDLDDPECAFPLGDSTTGAVEAVGTWQGDTVLLALRFVDVRIDGGSLWATDISALTATIDEDGTVDVVFVDQDVDGIDTGEIDVGQSGWSIQADLADGPAGSVLRLDGGGQRATSDADVVQLASVMTVMDGACRQNPIDGIVTMERADGDADVAITGLTFDETCDGQGKVEASLGLDIANSQKSFPVDLWQR